MPLKSISIAENERGYSWRRDAREDTGLFMHKRYFSDWRNMFQITLTNLINKFLRYRYDREREKFFLNKNIIKFQLFKIFRNFQY